VAEMAPVANRFVTDLRNRGTLIVHAPSDTLDRYRDHPARERALVEAAPQAGDRAWMRHDPACEGVMPIDDTDGGCACSPRCAESAPWTSQIADIAILPDDVITDSAEVFRVYESRGIDTVIVLGVHANMCVLGRPFGIRATVRRGYRALLVRDLTDAMYNPAMRPWVDHFTGTDLVVRHIETYWCPTFTSDEVLGGSEFRCVEDMRGR
jgi:nicotinamidase-related amidase